MNDDRKNDLKTFLNHSAYTIAVLALLITINPSILPSYNDDSNINYQLQEINLRLGTLEREQIKVSTEILMLQNSITNYHSKIVAGDLNATRSLNITVENSSISIDPSLNNSTCNGRFAVFGTTTVDPRLLTDGIYKLYVIIKMNDLYMVQSEGYADDSQKWMGYRPCLIPDDRYNATIYAIITKEELLIASILEKMPEYTLISDPIYKYKKS